MRIEPTIRLAVAVLLVWVALCSGAVRSRAEGNVVLALDAGAGHMPLESWKEFWSPLTTSYTSDGVVPYVEAAVAYVASGRHGLRLSIERLAIEASESSVMVFTDVSGTPTGETANTYTQWDISAIPVNLSYEFHPLGYGRLSPFVGLGAGYYFSAIETRSVVEDNPVIGSSVLEGTREGKGYGVHVYLGLRVPISSRLGFNSRLRFRHSDGMEFSENKVIAPVEFTGIDLTIGLDLGIQGP